ncbi:MAG: family transporter [Clostridia bacterium]|nr:family transporter [Clostridia bacterium]
MDKKLLKSYILLITYCILLIVALVKIDTVLTFILYAFSLLTPLFIGIAIAFILNRPYSFIYKLFCNLFNKSKDNLLIKIISIIFIYLSFFAIIGGIISFIIPQLTDSTRTLIENMDSYWNKLQEFVTDLSTQFNITNLDFTEIKNTVQQLLSNASSIFTDVFSRIFIFTTSVFSSVTNFILGLILSIYLLADKIKLKKQFIGIIKAYIPKKISDSILEIGSFTIEIFSNFITGQITEAFIIGILCFIGMNIFGFGYPLLISTLVGVTNLIPIAGPFIGAIPSAFILLMIDPFQALWFIIFITILQQLESNLIYPKVVGSSVGLPAIWVLISIIIGGGLFGVLGMLLAVPTVSVIYKLLKIETERRLKEKNISIIKK